MSALNQSEVSQKRVLLNINSENERKNMSLPHGLVLEIEPENVEPVVFTHFDCWSPTGDEKSGQYSHDSKEAIETCFNVLKTWSQNLNLPELDPIRMYGSKDAFRSEYLTHGQSKVFEDARDICVNAGYSVYSSDTRIEIYRTEDLDLESNVVIVPK